MDERRSDSQPPDGAYFLAVLYTLGYLGMMAALMFFNIPENNRELMLTLVGIMSAAQLGIIKYYYDGSKGAKAYEQLAREILLRDQIRTES